MRISEHLNLHVSRALNELFDVHSIVAESVLRFTARGFEGSAKLGFILDDAHSLPTPARCCLQQHRIPELRRGLCRGSGIGDRLRRARDHGRPDRKGELSSGGLAAHRGDGFRRRPDEHESCIPHGASEPLSLRQKSIPGVDGLRSGGAGDLDDPFAHEIAFSGWRGADVECFVRFAHVDGACVGIAVNRNRCNAQFPTRSNHAQGNLAAIGDQNFVEHRDKLLGRFATVKL